LVSIGLRKADKGATDRPHSGDVDLCNVSTEAFSIPFGGIGEFRESVCRMLQGINEGISVASQMVMEIGLDP
jgi:hypothetical protein